jgi:endonuclease YncB( thermonuclease family)
VYLGERDVSLEMVKEGMAWHYKKYIKEAQATAPGTSRHQP